MKNSLLYITIKFTIHQKSYRALSQHAYFHNTSRTWYLQEHIQVKFACGISDRTNEHQFKKLVCLRLLIWYKKMSFLIWSYEIIYFTVKIFYFLNIKSPVYCVRVLDSTSGQNLVSISNDGKLCNWSIENLNSPIDSQDLIVKHSTNKAVYATCIDLQYNVSPNGDDRSLAIVGTEDGFVHSFNLSKFVFNFIHFQKKIFLFFKISLQILVTIQPGEF